MVDNASKLAWKRCTDGQTWDGATCSGQAEGHRFGPALNISAPADGGFVWRLPRADELATLVIANASCVPAIDQEIFPRTVPSTYWTSQSPPKVVDMAYCQSFGAGASASQREECWTSNQLPVRLVSTLPLRGYLPVAPTAASFDVDDAGTHLVVFGSNFSRTVADNLVNFPTATGVKPVVASRGTGVSLTVAIPDDATTGAITVTTKGITSQPARGTLRVVNSRDGCAAAGFTPATIPTSLWEYCIFNSSFQDSPGDVLIIGAHPAKLPSTQPSYTLSTSALSKATAASLTLLGRVALQYGPSGLYGALVIESNDGRDADSLTTTGVVSNNGVVDNRGNFTNAGSFLNLGNGVVFNSGVFTNNQSPENSLSIGTTGRAINGVSFSNASGPGWPRAQLKNLGTLTTESGSTGIENAHGDVINNGTMVLEGARVFVNRSGSAPGIVTNNGSISLRIGTQPEWVPIISNERGATIINNTGALILNTPAVWTFLNNGTVQNCGTIKGSPLVPNAYSSCVSGGASNPAAKRRRR